MGNCFGTPRNEPSVNIHQLSANYGSSQPPTYSVDHNQSCRILRSWEDHGSESRNFKYVLYVVNNNLYNKSQKLAQRRLLEFIQQLASIQELDVSVKCLDYSQTTSDPVVAEEMQLYQEMLASEANQALDLWDKRRRRNSGAVNLGGNRQHTSEQKINELVKRLRETQDLDNSSAKDLMEPELVAALSKFAQEWQLEYFLQNQEAIFSAPHTIVAKGVSKIRAAFILQTRVIATSWSSEDGGLPTVGITLAPDSIPDMTMTSIQNCLETVYSNRPRRKGLENTGRMDGYTMQTISVGSKGGGQWKRIDDLKKGQEDIADHTHLDTERFLSLGPGEDLAEKVLLGSTNANIDRDYRGKSVMKLYGEGSWDITKQKMDNCQCQMAMGNSLDMTGENQVGSKAAR